MRRSWRCCCSSRSPGCRTRRSTVSSDCELNPSSDRIRQKPSVSLPQTRPRLAGYCAQATVPPRLNLVMSVAGLCGRACQHSTEPVCLRECLTASSCAQRRRDARARSLGLAAGDAAGRARAAMPAAGSRDEALPPRRPQSASACRQCRCGPVSLALLYSDCSTRIAWL